MANARDWRKQVSTFDLSKKPYLQKNMTSCHCMLTLVTKQPQRKVDRGFALLRIEWQSRKTQTIAQWVVVHCEARCIISLHGPLPSLLSSFLLLSRQPWEQLPEWLECSGECRYVQAQLFYTFLSGDSPACASPWVFYKTRPHLLHRESLHFGLSLSDKWQYGVWVVKWAPSLRFHVTFGRANL